MEEFHWTPEQIANMSYKKIQQILILKNQRYEVQRINENISRTKSHMSRGGSFVREI